MKHLLIALIKLYRKAISPLFRPKCRFTPTSSEYGLEAIERYGAIKGGWLTLRRFLRCHPYYKGDYYDPVP